MKEKAKTLLAVVEQIEEILQLILSHPDPLLKELDSFPVPICIFDLNGIFHKVNQTYCQHLGYTAQELIGNTFRKVLPKENQEEIYQNFIESFRQGMRYKGTITEVRHKKGHTFPIVFSNVKIAGPENQDYRMGLVAEISDLQQTGEQIDSTVDQLTAEVRTLERQLDSQEVARSALLHDIKKPFHNILGICSILSSPSIDQQEKKMWIETIEEVCKKGLKQAEAMQGISKMERGLYEPNLNEINLLEFLQKVTQSLQTVIESKELHIDLSYNKRAYRPELVCALEGDELYLELLFSNLLLNAIEASPEGQTIIVNINEQAENIQVSVHNQGVVPSKVREHFFDKYVTEGKSKGTGMGTYIAKLIVDGHNGNITMETSEEKGTTITVWLPKRQQHLKAA